MSVHALRPWTDLVTLHSDVESGALTEAQFAIDLGAIATGDPNVPAIYRDPTSFFRATYLTTDLRKLLDEVLASLAGRPGYNRVLKLRTPFGGGKSHTLASLLHAARNRHALDVIPEAKGFVDPGAVAVAVFDGEKFDAHDGKRLDDGRVIRTMWGWLAWQIDPDKAYPIVAGHDQDRSSPGGDVIREMLTQGASGRPVLLLLDEVLKYMERAASVAVLDSTLQRQAKDFFQNLTVEVANSSNAALVYSLTWSARESLGNVALLAEIDKLAARVDQLREPVSGDEVLPILQRRLLGAAPNVNVAGEVAEDYADAVKRYRRAHADTPSDRQRAEDEGLLVRDRIQSAYPFHPALIDLMRERWTALDAFQRTRGALRFLASCLHSLKQYGGARPLLGPGEVPLNDVEVRVKLLKELGAQNDYDAVIVSDIEGPNARAKRIDEGLARETPALSSAKPATRLATAILLYSFGGLRRDDGNETETLPPGVTESELLAACVSPDLDPIMATAVLSELRTACLYLHFDGVRYAFKKDPNVTKLIEDAEQEVSREDTQAKGRGLVRAKIREMLEQRLGGHYSAYVWPDKSSGIPDQDPRFLIGYLPLEFVGDNEVEKDRQAKEFFAKYGDRPRRYKNGIGLAVPDKKQIEALRRAVRYLLAIERVDARKRQLRLTKDQDDQLKERRRTEEGAAESALRELYNAVWLPRIESGDLVIEKIEKGGKPLQATGIHERVMELLTSHGAPKVHGSITARKIIERLHLGEAITEGEPPRLGIAIADIVEAFYRDIEPPRLDTAAVLRKAIARGLAESTLAYTSGAVPKLGTDNKYQVNRDRVVVNHAIADDEIDLESGFVMLPSAVPEPVASVPSTTAFTPLQEGAATLLHDAATASLISTTAPTPDKPTGQAQRTLKLTFTATRGQIFKAFPAIANLADKSDGGKITITVESQSQAGFDPAWLRNAVEEPLDEADVERKDS
jgi:hypothetical protein